VGECDDRIVAIGGLRVLHSGVGELKRMRIHPEYFGRSYDQMLLDTLTDRALALGASRLLLDIDERRVPAQELYVRNGFVRQGTLVVGRTPSVVFEKPLGRPDRQDLDELLSKTLTAANLTGLAVAWRRADEDPVVKIVGNDIYDAPLTTDALYPTASLTKLTVALAILRLADQGTVDLDAPLKHVLPEAAAERATLRSLLCHTAGLPEMPTVTVGTWREIGPSCLTTPPDHEPGTRVLYSNQGYGLLGIALERVTGRPFGKALRSLVIEPLGLDAHVADALPRQPVQGWKFRVLPAGGVFMTIEAALKLVEAFRNPPIGFLSEALVSAATTDQTRGVPGGVSPRMQWTRCPWGLGPEIHDDRYSLWIPRSASALSFGHAGASGCVAWCDPESDVSWAVLTVPPSDRSADIRWHLQGRPNLADIGEAILTQ
jgi:CubicO group peptidase (beta-lactamase class C family)